jgi:hypothetical protein
MWFHQNKGCIFSLLEKKWKDKEAWKVEVLLYNL